ncbi:hypothetical protein CCY99_01265 [Helicobacter sp. 16-1353]|uniref:DUF2443 family protein n=1 Tax=Helicobacter sp. 16-1353 TaxID=2004996 RepID=UPI000DCDC627|nr:DUF2443 family protein [Helicobacter sp. 16-1353]RAX55355.1 hypothetical protein CCY99_01265 [Helicobacter sp. 16-1353]
MFDKIDSILRDIEDIEQEIKILLNIHKITLIDYIMIKRCSIDYPPHIKMWMIEQIDNEIDKLKLKIDELNKVKKEFLIW